MSDDRYEEGADLSVLTSLSIAPGSPEPVMVEFVIWDEPLRDDEAARRVLAALNLEETIILIKRLQKLVDLGSTVSPLVPIVKRPPKKKQPSGKKGSTA